MAVLVDTNVIVSFLIDSEKNHKKADLLFQSFFQNIHGSLFTTDFILDEVITLLWSRFKRKDIVEKAYAFLSEDGGIFQLIITKELNLIKSWEFWMKYAEYPKRPLSFTDCSLLAIAEEYSIEYLATFDAEFSGLIQVLN